MMNNLFGVYGGIVEAVDDPDNVGRVKVRVPAVFGTADEVPTNALPWALPRGLPFGSTKESGGISWLPSKNDTVWVTFLDGEPEKPLWEWAIAPVASAAYLHKYENGTPKRACLTRYGHIIEFNNSSIIITTPTGEAAIFDTTNKTIQLQNQAKYIVRIDPEEITLRAGTQMIKVDNVGTQINFIGKDINTVATDEVTAKGQQGTYDFLRTFKAKAATQVKLESPVAVELDGKARVNITSAATVNLTVGDSKVSLTPASLELSIGVRKLTITAGGFTFA
jgi:hypothetical protein